MMSYNFKNDFIITGFVIKQSSVIFIIGRYIFFSIKNYLFLIFVHHLNAINNQIFVGYNYKNIFVFVSLFKVH